MGARDLFAVPRTRVTTSEGPVEFPIFYHDLSGLFLNYFVDYVQVASLLAGTGLTPCRFFNGKSMVSLIFYEYRQTSIGAYNEATIVLMVRPEGEHQPVSNLVNFLRRSGAKWTMGGYVLEMPVTLPLARAAGREIWGYPKFETQIPFKMVGKRYEFSVLDPVTGEEIFSVRGSLGVGLGLGAFDFVTFSNHGDQVLKTIIDVEGKFKVSLNKEVKLQIGPGNHRMAQHLRVLGFDRLAPFAVISTDRCRTRLNQGVSVRSWKTAPRPYPIQGEFETAAPASS